MRKALCFLICLLLAAAPCLAGGSEDPGVSKLRREAQAKYIALSRQAAAMMKEPITVPQPPSTAVSCSDKENEEADSQSLTAYMETFKAPEGPLCAQMLEIQKQLQLMGAEPDYTREAALMDRLGQKALSTIKDYGQDIEKVPAIAMAAMQTATEIQLLGLDQAGYAGALMDAVSAMYAAAVEKLFRMLTEGHDYTAVQPILDAARASLLLSGASGVDSDAILSRLQKALRFELTLNANIDSHSGLSAHWVEQAVFEVVAELCSSGIIQISGTGTGSLLSFVWDDIPEASETAPDFPVEAIFEHFDPCGAGVDLLLTPFHPLLETLHVTGEGGYTADWPYLKNMWVTLFEESLQEGGSYRFPLTLHNLEAIAVDETLEYKVPYNQVKLQITLVHKPVL